MPAIPPPARRQPLVTLSTRIEAELLELLDQYCRFAGCGRKHVVTESLRRTLDEDRDFQAWRQSDQGPEPGAASHPPAKANFA